MNREEARMELIRTKRAIYMYDLPSEAYEAIDMAIEALTEPKTIIGIDIPYGSDKGLATVFKGKNDKLILEEVKEIMSVVRCKDCKFKSLYEDDDDRYYYCALEDRPNRNWSVDDTDFCSWGERREP